MREQPGALEYRRCQRADRRPEARHNGERQPGPDASNADAENHVGHAPRDLEGVCRENCAAYDLCGGRECIGSADQRNRPRHQNKSAQHGRQRLVHKTELPGDLHRPRHRSDEETCDCDDKQSGQGFGVHVQVISLLAYGSRLIRRLVIPWSAIRFAPVTQAESSESRNTQQRAISSGSINLPAGMLAFQ